MDVYATVLLIFKFVKGRTEMCDPFKNKRNGKLKMTLNIEKIISLTLFMLVLLTGCGKASNPSETEALQSGTLKMLTDIDGIVNKNYTYNKNGMYSLLFHDNDKGANILYTDFATKEQVYLCTNPSCAHDSAACASWIKDTTNATGLFTLNDTLFVFSLGLHEVPGSITTMNLDGSQLKKLVTFQKNAIPANGIAGNDQYLYYIEQMPDEMGEVNQYVARCSLQTGEIEHVFSFSNNISNTIYLIGVSGNSLVLQENIFEESRETRVIYLFDTGKKELNLVKEVEASRGRVYQDQYIGFSLVDGQGYVLDLNSQKVKEIPVPKDFEKDPEGIRIHDIYDGKIIVGMQGSIPIQEVDWETVDSKVKEIFRSEIQKIEGRALSDDELYQYLLNYKEDVVEISLVGSYALDLQTYKWQELTLLKDEEGIDYILPLAESKDEFLVCTGYEEHWVDRYDMEGRLYQSNILMMELGCISKADYWGNIARYKTVKTI